MKLGLIPINIGVRSAEQIVETAVTAEEAGFESVWTFEHAIVPVEYQSKYPYSASGKMGATPETNFVDPLIALTAVAARTSKIRLGTGVNILSQTNPLLLAKQTASLDFVSNGRFMLGVGIGWLREEFDAMGTPFERRGARFDDYIQAMRKVWSGEVVEHESEFLSWHGFKSYPLPVQNPFPVVIGGSKGKVYERIAKYGNGWYVPGGLAELPGMLAELRKTCEALGRNPDEIEISAMWPGQGGAEAIKAHRDLGVHRLVVPMGAQGAKAGQMMKELAEQAG
ncbi:MAG: LLM class F420-dependent oxidoreductase [Dehalococcoidia bacterium]